MLAARPVMSLPTPRVPVHRFRHFGAAVRAMARYETGLGEDAARTRSRGSTVLDQGQAEEMFCLSPGHPLGPALAIVGGMGPLAGAVAFRAACARFQDSRTVVLYQACGIPDRSALILCERGSDPSSIRGMTSRLTAAVRHAVGLAGPAAEPVRCIIACNSAHYFLPLLEDDLDGAARRWRCDVRMISLVASSVEALRRQPCQKALLLATEGARVGQVFSTPLRDAGIAFEEPSPAEGRLLMRAIFEGMKSLDPRRAVELGNELFESVLGAGRDYDCIVAGCTEVPLIIDLLRLRGSSAVVSFLSRVRIIDPLDEALCRA